MSKFVFKLDGVLRHRERIEQDRQRDLAVAQAEMVRLERGLGAFTEEVQKSTADVRDNHLVGRLNMGYLAAHRRYMLGMQRKIHTLAQQMAAQQQRVDEARRVLTEATKQKKVLQKLRERQQQRWASQEARREAGALDELSTQLSHRMLAGQTEAGQ